ISPVIGRTRQLLQREQSDERPVGPTAWPVLWGRPEEPCPHQLDQLDVAGLGSVPEKREWIPEVGHDQLPPQSSRIPASDVSRLGTECRLRPIPRLAASHWAMPCRRPEQPELGARTPL